MARVKMNTGATAVVTAVALMLSALVLSDPSQAAPSEAEVESAKARLRDIEHELEVVIERWNDARYRLQQAEASLAETQQLMKAAERQAADTYDRLADRAVEAYTGVGSQFSALLDAQDMSELSDRMQYMGAIAQSDADLATQAETARLQLEWAAERQASAVAEAQRQLDEMERERNTIAQMLDEQEGLARQLENEFNGYQEYLARQREALEVQEAAQPSVPSANDSTAETADNSNESTDEGYVPPANGSAAQIAVSAALSEIGTPYVWGSATPGVAFDCSGLTSWAWGQAGVSVPHSSQAQYTGFPSVPLDEIQPGDLLFFYQPVSHVAMYIGDGKMVHARHPGPGGQVQVTLISQYGEPPHTATRPG